MHVAKKDGLQSQEIDLGSLLEGGGRALALAIKKAVQMHQMRCRMKRNLHTARGLFYRSADARLVCGSPGGHERCCCLAERRCDFLAEILKSQYPSLNST
jgi:hypothetical protein